MNNIAIIPARGGSKRIPRKNLYPLNGKPMIAYAIELAQESGLFRRIIVSTDDEEIAAVSQEYGAETPFVRPPELSDDFTGTTPVLLHALNWLISQGDQPDAVCKIYPTCPLLKVEYLTQGYQALKTHDFAFAASTFDFPIQRALRKLDDGGVEPMFPEHIASRSQDLEEAIHDVGQFYWGKTDSWLQNKAIFNTQSSTIMIPRRECQDIDCLDDLLLVEALLIAC